jgi:hypothetical protein
MQLDVGLGKDGAASLPSLQDFFGSVPERPQSAAPKKPRVAAGEAGAEQAASRRSSKGEKREQQQEGSGGGGGAAACRVRDCFQS